jgi:putative ABC transport system substrate-binding protein
VAFLHRQGGRRSATAIAIFLLATSFATAAAQPPGKPYRVGVLWPTVVEANPVYAAFRQGLADLGWVEGKSIVVELRTAQGNIDRLPDLAADLVRLNVDVIMTGSTPSAVAARNATRSIPIVMGTSADPVRLGLVASLARPGGNVTGLAYDENLQSLAKILELLTETIPTVRRVAVLSNPDNAAHAMAKQIVSDAAQSRGIQLRVLETRDLREIDAAFAGMTRERVAAAMVITDSLFTRHLRELRDLAAKSRIPVVYGQGLYPEAGGLMSYGVDLRDSFRRAATYVDKILKGARPADLPIEQPTRYELVINRKTAKALGLVIPQSVLVRTDRFVD